MENLVGNNFKFIFSGQPSRLEEYRCFDDSSNPKRITGDEILKNSDWDENRKKRWYYFYRPYDYGNTIAPLQKKKIKTEEEHIDKISREIANSIFLTVLSMFLIFTNIFFNLFYFTGGGVANKFSMIAILFVLISHYFYTENRKIIRAEKKKIIKILRDEISYLYQQKSYIESNRLTKDEITSLFWEDVRELENENLKKINKGKDNIDTIKDNAPPFYKNIKFDDDIDISYFPTFPVIPSWALLQKSQKHSISGSISSTGIAVAEKDLDLGSKIATWRNAKGNKPLFRLWYIQFLFFQGKNITLVSFYYDFISKKTYSKYIEVYQYTHITNYSYIDEDISYMKKDNLIKKIPKKLRNNIFGNEVKKISFSSASGSYYECVIPDKDVTNGLNKWIEYKNDIEKEYGSENDFDKIKNIKANYNKVIATLANESFLLLKDRVNKFSISDI